MKTKHAPEFIELENQLWAWFRRNETKHAAITGDLLKFKALHLAGELKLEEFRASDGWIRNFKTVMALMNMFCMENQAQLTKCMSKLPNFSKM